MREVRAFMALHVVDGDVEKYQLNWLRVLYYARGLGFKSYVCQLCVIYLLLYFYKYVILLWNDIILKLYSLARNMNWFDGYAWIWHL